MNISTVKWLLGFLFLFSSVLNASAEPLQNDSPRNVITVEPIDLILKAHISYEHVLNNKCSIGVGAHYYYFDESPFLYPGYKTDIFFRYYYAPFFYIQPMISAYGSLEYDGIFGGKYYSKFGGTGGGSFSWGMRKVFPKSHFTVDLSIGLQFLPIYYQTDEIGSVEWYYLGPGGVLLPRIAIGYAF